ncbi:hypothetical protein HA402_015234 [Bradysia odoriphaga]|nr:hypothetical protein HA402_015234 [Bradysia odoriphaga]
MNKEKEATSFSFLHETRIELLRKLVIKIINGYEAKWKEDRDTNYVKTSVKQCGIGKKLCKLLPKHESYILNCLEIHWRRIEDKLETLNWDFQPDVDSKLFGILREIEKQLTPISESAGTESCSDNPCSEEAIPFEFGLREEDFELNLKLNESEANSVSNSLCTLNNNPDVLNSLTNFYIFVNCDMNDEKLNNQLNSICSVDFLFHTKNGPQMNNKPKPSSLELPPFNASISNLKVVDKSFKDLDNIDTLSITSPTAIPLHNNQICYINFSKLWKESRWSTVKQRLIQRGVMESNGMYVVFPIYRKEFVIGRGSFGDVEFGLSRTYHGIALKRLTENGFCSSRYDELQSVLSRFSELTCENLHKSRLFQDMAGYVFLSSRICEYNLGDYIQHMKSNINEWNAQRKLSTFLQIVKGLTALHLNVPIIVHGNLKPSNVLIDENGVVKLAEFGIFAFLYDNDRQINEADKIWRPNEVDSLQKNCNSMSDIYSLGLLTFFIYSNGMVPKDPKDIKIFDNVFNIELVQLLHTMIHHDPVQRPTVSEIHK